MLNRALDSVSLQYLQPERIRVANDFTKDGAAINRDRGLAAVDTSYVAFLDDDDEFYVHHLADLYTVMVETDADLVYPWFDVIGGTDPFPMFEGRPWDDADPHQVPITFMAKTASLTAVGGFSGGFDINSTEVDEWGNRAGEDYNMILKLVAANKKIVHHPFRTWAWHHHATNTMGLPTRW